MKNYKLMLSALFGAALLLTNLTAQAAGERTGVVTLINLVGKAVYSEDGGHTWIPAVVGKEFRPGTLIRTEDRSLANVLIGESAADRVVNALQLQTASHYYNSQNLLLKTAPPIIERNIIRLQPNTILGVDKLLVPDSDPSVVSDCELDLKKGKVLATVRKVAPSSEYLVKVPNGVAAVRGTQFSLSVEGVNVDCSVADGTVWLSMSFVNASGTPLTDSSGNPLPPVQITISPGQSFSLTPSVISTIQGEASSSSTVTGAENSINNTINTLIVPTPGPLNSVLVTFFDGLVTTTITVTAPTAGTPPDSGNPVVISSQ